MRNKKSKVIFQVPAICISLLLSLLSVSCSCGELLVEPPDEFSLSVVDSHLTGANKQFTAIVKLFKNDEIITLKNFKLQAQIIEKQSIGSASDDNYLVYTNRNGQQNIVTCLSSPLTEFTKEKKLLPDAQDRTLHIPITLRTAEDLTQCKVHMQLIDSTECVLASAEVEWIKDALIIVPTFQPQQDEEEGLVSFTIENKKENPIQPDQVYVSITSNQGKIFHFVDTKSSEATLDQLLSKPVKPLALHEVTSPIPCKLISDPKKNSELNLIIALSDKSGKLLTTKTIKWPYVVLAPISLKQSTSLKERKKEKVDSANVLKDESIYKKAPSEMNKEEKVDKKKKKIDNFTKDQISENILADNEGQPEATVDNKIETNKEIKNKAKIDEESTNKLIKEKPTKPSHKNGINKKGKIAKETEIKIEGEKVEENEAGEKSPERKKGKGKIEKNQAEEIKIKEEKVKESKTEGKAAKSNQKEKTRKKLPNFSATIKRLIEGQKQEKNYKRFNLYIGSLGEPLSTEMLDTIYLQYTITSKDEHSKDAKIIRQGDGNKEDINGMCLGQLLRLSSKTDKKETNQLMINTSKLATKLTVTISFKGLNFKDLDHIEPIILKWERARR